MKDHTENGTALLAIAFGISLLTASTAQGTTGARDAGMARELAVLSRVLEKRLAETRETIAGELTSAASVLFEGSSQKTAA